MCPSSLYVAFGIKLPPPVATNVQYTTIALSVRPRR